MAGARRILINGAEVDYKKNGFQDSTSTFIWTAEKLDCLDGINEIWQGSGIKYTHTENKQVLIVKDPSKDVYAGMLYIKFHPFYLFGLFKALS